MDNNNMNIKQTIQLLGIQEITTPRQKKNGTREFKLPVKDQYGGEIHVASFASGYVRRTKAGGHCPSWQLNKTKKVPSGYKDWQCTERILIPNEQDRLEYLISFCLKNYYIGQANMLSNGNFIPKWKHEDAIDKAKCDTEAELLNTPEVNEEFISRSEHRKLMREQYINGSRNYSRCKNPEVKVIVNGQRYNII